MCDRWWASDLLLLRLRLQQALIPVVLESPQLLLQLLSLPFRPAEGVLHLLPQLAQGQLLLRQQAATRGLLWGGGRAAISTRGFRNGVLGGEVDFPTFSETSLSTSS